MSDLKCSHIRVLEDAQRSIKQIYIMKYAARNYNVKSTTCDNNTYIQYIYLPSFHILILFFFVPLYSGGTLEWTQGIP